MKAKRSPLKYESFYVVNFDYKFKYSDSEEITDVNQLPYEVEVDFLHHEREGNSFNVYIKVEVNFKKEKLPGYSFFVEAVGGFGLQKEGLSEQAQKNLTLLSPLTMLISSVRGFILQVSAQGAAGKYILPSIDVYDLVNQKTGKRKRKPRSTSSSEE